MYNVGFVNFLGRGKGAEIQMFDLGLDAQGNLHMKVGRSHWHPVEGARGLQEEAAFFGLEVQRLCINSPEGWWWEPTLQEA